MFDMSWGEMLVIGAVALIVIGPKDLPKALRTLGNMTAKVRRMASEFQSQFNDAMREAELDEIRKQVESVNHSVASLDTSFNPVESLRNEVKGAIEAPVATGAAPQPGGDADSGEPLSIAPASPTPSPVEAGIAPVTEAAPANSVSPEAKPDGARA